MNTPNSNAQATTSGTVNTTAGATMSTLDGVDLAEIADRYGTPCFVYSANYARSRYAELADALGNVPHTICYAVKANSTLGILELFAELGAGFDIVSGGELVRVLEAGGDA